jgi:AcrR family transcriptional regulator
MAVRSPGFGRGQPDVRSQARDVLLDTALRLFAERGYIGVRVEDIATAAGISRATFYKHFSEREEILAELFARLLGRDPVPPPPGGPREALSRVRALLTAGAAQMQGDEQLARFVYTLPIRHTSLIGAGASPPVLETVQRLVEEGAGEGAVRADVSPALITAHIARTFEAAMRDWAEGRVPDAAAHVSLLLDLAFDGVTSAPAATRRTRTTTRRDT